MYRGTTPTHIFNVPIDTSEIKEVKINYSQNDELVLSKRLADCKIEDGKIIVKLTQEDTFLFKCSSSVSIQLRVLTKGDDALISAPMKKSLGECLADDEVLV